MRPVMIIDDEANYMSGSDLGTDIPPTVQPVGRQRLSDRMA